MMIFLKWLNHRWASLPPKKNNLWLIVLLLFGLAVMIQARDQRVQEETQKLNLPIPVYPYPVKKTFAPPPVTTAKAVVVLDKNSVIPLYLKNEKEKLLPASTVKIMTALVALEHYSLEDVLTVGQLENLGQRVKLVFGEKIRVKELLKALLVYSANDAAQVLAQNYPGGEVEFVKTMNQKAISLGLEQSYFANSTGLDSDAQKRILKNYSYTTARDLAQLTRAALKNDFLAKTVGVKSAVISDVNGQRLRQIENLNQLLGQVAGVMGVKTGWTEEAGGCLVSEIERDNNGIIVVVLGSTDRFKETKQLIDWVYLNFIWQEMFPAIVGQVPVSKR